MPSDQSTWIVAIPETEGIEQELANKLARNAAVAALPLPPFKTGTLESLISLSEELPKQETFFTATVAKIVDTLRSLLNNDPIRLSQHILVNEKPVDSYLLDNWEWNQSRYGIQKSLPDMVDTLNKEMASIDNGTKAKLNNYNLVKGSLVQMQRKKTGNLSIRSLVDIVSRDNFVQDSEYLETLLVAVPKANIKDWNTKYERFSNMVVPRSSAVIASDEEYTLVSVVVFRKVRDEFIQKCRENKFVIRDFVYSEDEVAKQQQELSVADTTEKELWTELLHISRTNFSESFQLLVHIKVVRLFVESVLRYGLPAHYSGLVVKPETSKTAKRTFDTMQSHFTYLRPKSKKNQGQGATTGDDFAGEYQSLMEQEFFDFVLYEVPWIT